MPRVTDLAQYNSWDALNTFLHDGSDPNYRKLCHNTYAERLHVAPIGHYVDKPKPIAVRYHNTYIATFHHDGTLVLNTGGWHTSTTKTRLNHLLPDRLAIHQQDYEWYLTLRVVSNEWKVWANTHHDPDAWLYEPAKYDFYDMPFGDGMVIDANHPDSLLPLMRGLDE